MTTDNSGIVYILSNVSMPGIIKIGKTTNLEKRMSDLFNTSVPTPFRCEVAYEVDDMHWAEERLHMAFGECRVNAKREFFKIAPFRARAALELIGKKDVSIEVEKEIEVGLSDEEKVATKRPKMTFKDLEIPVGGKLEYLRDASIQVEVVDGGTTVRYNGETGALSPITAKILGNSMSKTSGVRGTSYWKYNGRDLEDLYYEKYP
jgi:hypothetical protein